MTCYGAEAQWHDQDAGQRRIVTAGGSNRRRLKRVYSSEATAHAAAQAETGRLSRVSATVEITLPYGDARALPGTKVRLSGFRTHIDSQFWKITQSSHNHGAAGFYTNLVLDFSA